MERDKPPVVRNFGEFFTLLKNTDNPGGELWLYDIRRDIPDADWDEIAAKPVDIDMVDKLIAGVLSVVEISRGQNKTKGGKILIRQSGAAFVNEIQDKAKAIGIGIKTKPRARSVNLLNNLINTDLAEIVPEETDSKSDRN